MANDTTQQKRRVGLPPWLAKRRSMEPKLLVVDGAATKSEIDIKLPLTIGRDQAAGLVIAHPLVSRQHCALMRRDDSLWVKDLNSSNGTFINGKRVSEGLLQPGDKLTVGPLTFVAIYQQAGLMTQRQLARQLAAEARRRQEASPDDDTVTSEQTLALERAVEQAMAAATASNATAHTSSQPGNQALAVASPSSQDHHSETRSVAKSSAPAASGANPTSAPDAKSGKPAAGDQADLGGQAPSEGTDSSSMDDEQIGLFFTWAQQMARATDRKKSGESAGGERPKPAKPADSPNDDDVLDADMADHEKNASEQEAGTRTMLAADLPKNLTNQEPVQVQQAKPKPAPEPARGGGSASSQRDKPTRSEVVFGYMLSQINVMQTRIFEHYQQATITMQLVSRLQQDQWELIREELDRLCSLNDLLRRTMAQRYPNMPLGGNEGEDRGQKQVQQASLKTEEALEQMHGQLLQQMSDMQKSSRQQWKQIRQFLHANGIEPPPS